MKKNTTKILVAALALFMAIGIATGSTFAWFALNTEVSATGMQVVAKSDNTFLLIGTGDNDTYSEIQGLTAPANTSVALTVAAADADLYPAHPVSSSGEAALIPASTGKKVGGDAITVAGAEVNSAATAAAVTNWYTATAATVDDEAMLAGSARQLTSFDEYVIVKTLYLTVAEGSNNANNLSVTASITAATSKTIDATRVMVVTSDGGFAILTPASPTADIKGSNTALTDTSVITVTVYIYVDGEDASIYTNNKADLDTANISLTFDVDPVPAP